MKILIALSLLFTGMAQAQNLDLKGFKTLLSQRQSVLEKVNQGMSKKISVTSKIPTELGFCEVKETSVQTVMKIEGDKMIVHSKEIFVPASTSACEGFEENEVSVLFYEASPSLTADFEDLDASAADIQSIVKNQEIVTMTLVTSGETVTVKYDLTKSSFKNLISMQDSNQSITSQDIADVDVESIDLSNVFFCESAESDSCVEGDYSDILF